MSGISRFGGPIKVPSLSSPPGSPENGFIYYDTTLGQFQQYGASGWVAPVDTGSLSASTGAATIGIADSGSIYTTTNVEDALQEVKVEADFTQSTKVTGPSSSTDNAITRFDTTTGKLVQNSLASIDDSGNIVATNLSGTNTGDVTLTAVGASPNADGASLSGQALTLQPASTSFPGVMSAADKIKINQAILADGTVSMAADQSMGSHNLTNVADPTSAQHAATKAYVDAVAQGLKPKQAVRVGTTVNVSLATDLENGDVIDGITLVTGDRVLVKNQSTTSQNGIYIVPVSGAVSRSTDFDSLSPIDEINGAYTFIQEGTQAGQGWVQQGTVAIIGTDPIVFVYFNSVAGIIGGDMITVTGSTISVDLATVSGLESSNPGNSAGQLRNKLEASNPTLQIDGSNQLGVKLDGSRAITTGASGIGVNVDNSTIEISSNATRLKDAGVTNAKLANMADNTVKANKSGGSAVPSDLALSDVTETGSSILTISNASKSVVSTSNLTIQANLTSAHLYVGNVSNVPVDVAASGDVTLANTGAFTVATVGTSSAANINSAELLANAATSLSTASAIARRDANKNFQTNMVEQGVATTVTAAGITTFIVSSEPNQQFTGTSTQTVNLPDATTLNNGHYFRILNRSTGSVTVKDGSGSTLSTITGGSDQEFTLISNATIAGNWDLSSASGTAITSLTGDVTATGPGAASATIASHAVSNAKFRQSASLSVVANATNATADVADLSAASDFQILRRGGTALAFGSVDLSQSGAVGSSILGVANGGTGAATLTLNNVILGNGTSAVQFVAPGTSGNVLTSNGTTWASAAATGGTGTSGIQNFYTQGDAETGVAGDLNTGNNATFDNAGSLGGTFTISTTAGDLIDGTKTFKLVGSATAGNNTNDFVASQLIPIPQGYRGRTLGLRLQYRWDGTSGNAKIVVKDATNTAILTFGTETLNQYIDATNKTAGTFYLTFFCPASCANVRVGPQIITGEVSKTLTWDDVIVSPELIATMPISPDTGWTSYTPTFTGFGTVTSAEAFWRRVGTNMEIRARWTNGTTTAVEAQVTLPTGYTSDSSASIDSVASVVGHAQDNRTNTASDYVVLIEPSKAYVTFSDSSSSTTGLTKMNGNITITGADVAFYASVPITNWSVSTSGFVTYNSGNMVNTALRVDTSNGYGSSSTKIRRFTNIRDNLGSAVTYTDSSTLGGTFTINISGMYFISYSDNTTSASSIGITKNDTELTTNLESKSVTSEILCIDTGAAALSANCSTAVQLNAGDVIRAHSDGNTGGTTGLVSFEIAYLGIPGLVGVPKTQVAYLSDVKTAGTSGGTFTSGAWRTRDLNTTSGNTSFLTLTSNQFVLQPGTYNIHSSSPAYNIGRHQAKLKNITASSDAIIGSSAYTGAGVTLSIIQGQIVLIIPTTYEIQHQSEGTLSGGLGVSSGGGFTVANEVYTQVKIEKVA